MRQLVMWECVYERSVDERGLQSWRVMCPNCGAMGTYRLHNNAERWAVIHQSNCRNV